MESLRVFLSKLDYSLLTNNTIGDSGSIFLQWHLIQFSTILLKILVNFQCSPSDILLATYIIWHLMQIGIKIPDRLRECMVGLCGPQAHENHCWMQSPQDLANISSEIYRYRYRYIYTHAHTHTHFRERCYICWEILGWDVLSIRGSPPNGRIRIQDWGSASVTTHFRGSPVLEGSAPGALPPKGESWNKKDLVHWLPGPFQTQL